VVKKISLQHLFIGATACKLDRVDARGLTTPWVNIFHFPEADGFASIAQYDTLTGPTDPGSTCKTSGSATAQIKANLVGPPAKQPSARNICGQRRTNHRQLLAECSSVRQYASRESNIVPRFRGFAIEYQDKQSSFAPRGVITRCCVPRDRRIRETTELTPLTTRPSGDITRQGIDTRSFSCDLFLANGGGRKARWTAVRPHPKPTENLKPSWKA